MPDQITCKLCGSPAHLRFTRPLARDLEGRYFECANCGLLQSDHLDRLESGEIAEIYDASDADLDPGAAWRLTHLGRRMEHLTRFRIIPGSSGRLRVLDFGSGPGFLVAYLSHRLDWDTWGYDPYVMPAFAAERRLKNWDEVEARGPYDLLIASEVFEHFTSPREQIAPLADILSPKGSLFITAELYERRIHGPDWPYLAPHSAGHVAFYSRRSLDEIASLLGMDHVHQAGSRYEWLFVRASSSGGRRVARALARGLFQTAVTLRLLPRI